MFKRRKKLLYKDVYEFLDEEWRFNHGLFLTYIGLAKTIKDPKLKQMHMNEASVYRERAAEIGELKAKLYKKEGRVV